MNIIVKPSGSGLFYCRPDTTWERENRDFYSPECVNEIWWTPVVFARVCKAGKCIGKKFVERYYDGVGCGVLLYGVLGQLAPTETSQALALYIDRSSILPMPLYDPCVMEDENEFVVRVGENDYSFGTGNAKSLLEETTCRASELTSLRIGDFVAVELEGMKKLAYKDDGSVGVKGTFCENEIFDFNVIL